VPGLVAFYNICQEMEGSILSTQIAQGPWVPQPTQGACFTIQATDSWLHYLILLVLTDHHSKYLKIAIKVFYRPDEPGCPI